MLVTQEKIMDLDEALELHNTVSVVDAMAEIANHGHECYVNNGVLWGSDGSGEFEQVCIVVNGLVLSRTVMLWLGY